MLRPASFTLENTTVTRDGDRRPALVAPATSVAALALAYAVTAGLAGHGEIPTPKDLTKEFSSQWGGCFGLDPTTAEAQDLYGPFVIEDTTVRIMGWKYDESGGRTPNSVPVHLGADGLLEGKTLVFHYDSASRSFFPEVPTSYLIGNTPCAPEPSPGVPLPHPQPLR